MFKENSAASTSQELDRHAYNAVFHELGLSWHWDKNSYAELLRQSDSPAEQIHHYLESRHPHLLKAYDASFLAQLIQTKMTECRKRSQVSAVPPSRNSEMSRRLDHQVGF